MSAPRAVAGSVLSALLLAACAEGHGVMRTYAGPKLPDVEVAKIGGTFMFYGLGAHAVLLEAIDDRRVTEGDLEVLPGQHTVAVKYQAATLNVSFSGTSPCFVTFDAQPGHSYIADGEADSTTWRCWIEDVQTKQRTDGTFSPPPGWTTDLWSK